jgi:hypothetical protein
MARKKSYAVLEGPLTMMDRLQLMQAEACLQAGLDARKADFRTLHRVQRAALEGQTSRREALFSLAFASLQDRAKCQSQVERLGLAIDEQGTVTVPCGRRDKVARVLSAWIVGVQDTTTWYATPGSITKVVHIADRSYRKPKRG